MTCRKPSAGFCITVGLVAVLVAYPLSFGPACWLCEHEYNAPGTVARAYHPLMWLSFNGPAGAHDVISWYGALWADVPILILAEETE